MDRQAWAEFRQELQRVLRTGGVQFPGRRYNESRMDSANASIFVENDLKQIIKTNYDTKYRDLDALEHVPMNPAGVNPGAMEWAYDSYEKRGSTTWIGAGVTVIPRADAKKTRFSFPVRTFAGAYGYNWEEMMASRFNNVPLDQIRAEGMRRGAAETEHDTILSGYAPLQIPGFLTNPATPRMTVPFGSWLSSATTGDQMLESLQAIAHNRQVATNRVEISDTILLPHAHFLRVSEKIRGSVNDTTVLELLKKTAPYITEVKPLIELATAGPGGTPIAIAYRKATDRVGAIIPFPFTQLDPQVQGLEVVLHGVERIGGTVWTYPASGVIADGI